MSLVPEIKNYLEFYLQLNSTTDAPIWIEFIHANIQYILKFLNKFVIYIFTFQWIMDFLKLPVLEPQWNFSNLIDLASFQNPKNIVYSYNFQEILPKFSFIEGFITSFFSSLPTTITHFIIIRRLTIEGISAALVAISGTIIANFVFLIFLVSGWRFPIFNWYLWEPISYIGGLIFILLLVYRNTHTPLKRISKNDYFRLSQIFFVNFILFWTEQYGLFPYLSSLTFHSGINLFDLLQTQNILDVIFYLFGFTSGLVCWFSIFSWLILKISNWMAQKILFSFSKWAQYINFLCLTGIITYTIASLPFYGLDYLLSSPLGFYSEDTALQSLELKTNIPDVKKGRLGEYSAHSSVDTDLALFDRGRYSTGGEIELTFEDMNFQGEYIWRSRNDRLSSGSAGIVNQFMSKFLPKNHKKQSQNIENSDLNTFSPFQVDSVYNFRSIFSQNNHTESLLERFLGDYNNEVKDDTLPESNLEMDNFSAFSELVKYGFDSFASLEDIESDEFEEELGKKIKKKYYNNPIYKFLMTTDISNFIRRQPVEYFLTDKEENFLFNKRSILMNYYNSLTSYSKLPYSEAFYLIFGGSKSYVNRVYNQQFKGTLKILRRLFLIDLETTKSCLKYDQILYKNNKENHEQFIHEELLENKSIQFKKMFFEEMQIVPFYVGWDTQFRKLVITNRFLNNQNLLNKNFFRSWYKQSKIQQINFSIWPIRKNKNTNTFKVLYQKFDQSKSDLQKDLFEYAESGDYETRLIYETLPSIVKRVDLRNKDKIHMDLKPTIGGFFWPGSS